MAGDLAGKVIIVAGGDHGVGREYALAYANEGSGIVVLHNQLDAAQCASGDLGASDPGWARPLRGDVIANAAELLHSSNARFVRGCILPGLRRS
jgi:NAD(P)-dependent dehydrogenase (short-subunit alcohol dehydrogenase family)